MCDRGAGLGRLQRRQVLADGGQLGDQPAQLPRGQTHLPHVEQLKEHQPQLAVAPALQLREQRVLHARAARRPRAEAVHLHQHGREVDTQQPAK